MMNQDKRAILEALRGRNGNGVQLSEYGLNRITQIPFSPLRIALAALVESGAVSKDGVRYSLKEVAHVARQT